MMFNEWLKDGSLFTEINRIKEFTFITLYGAENLDLVYRMTYGTRHIPSNMVTMTLTDVANIIIVTYGDNWNNKYNLLKDEILLGVESQIIFDETANDDIIKNSNRNSESKVSAFNDDEMSPNDSDTDSVNENTQKELNRNTTTKKVTMNAIKTQLELFNSNFVLDTVCKDISKMLSLSIY